MKHTVKYVGLDVHQATTVVSVRDPGGRVIAHSILHTDETEVVGFMRGLRGRVAVALEEGTQAQWLHDFGFLLQVHDADRGARVARHERPDPSADPAAANPG